MDKLSDLKEKINDLRYNPAGIQRTSLELLERVNNASGNEELDIVDPSNPFVFLLEASAVNASANMAEAEAVARQLYPSMALNEEELYRHMSDKDYIGRFSNPARTTFKLLFEHEELVSRAVRSEVEGVRKITIPRNTEFRVSDYVFTMEYPIEIRVMAHSGIHVVYDVSKPSPLTTVESNAVQWEFVRLQERDFVQIEVPVEQFELTSHFASINQSTGYVSHFRLKNHFYHCRVYRERDNGEWEEIRTTHTDQVFDPFEPTVVLKVLENHLQVTVPHVFVHGGQLDRELRIDIYTTKGPLDVLLDNYEINAFSVKWKDANRSGLDRFEAPLSAFSTMAVYSDSAVTGGSNPLSFEELRERVIANAVGTPNLPITDVQLTHRLESLGYRSIKEVDNITNRIYLASRSMPEINSADNIALPGCYYGRVQATFDDLVREEEVYDNGNRITLSPNTLYFRDNGVTRVFGGRDRDGLMAMSGEAFLQEVNAHTYLFSPFYWVLDADGDYFETRPYHLDDPEIVFRQFVSENDQLGLQLSTRSPVIERVEGGYRLQVTTRSGEAFQELDDDQIHVQISFRPKGENQPVHLKGELIGKKNEERIYEFHLESNFDIDNENSLALTKFALQANEERPHFTPLVNEFDIAFFVSDYPMENYDSVELDRMRAPFVGDADSKGLLLEQVRIRFGHALTGFWNNARSIIGSLEPRVYEEDVPSYYETNVYERDENGTIKIELDEDGNIQYKLLHESGEPVLDSEGEQVYLHRKGDPVVDAEGKPIYEGDRGILREMDLFLVDGKYYFADHEEDVEYRRQLAKNIISWLEDDIQQFQQWTLENTDIFLYLQPSMGPAVVRAEENEVRTIDLEQSITVTLYQDRDKYDDVFVRQTLNELVAEVLVDVLGQRRVTRSEIIRRISDKAGDDLISVHVEGLGGEDFSTFTMTDEVARCNLAKRLERTSEGRRRVVDDINLVYLLHED